MRHLVPIVLLSACSLDIYALPPDIEPSAAIWSGSYSTSTSEPAPILPGDYDTQATVVPAEACGDIGAMLVPRSATLDWIDTDRFTWLDGVECQLWGPLYTCDMSIERRTIGPDLELLVTRRAVGHVLDPQHLEEELTVHVSCDGSGCADYVDAPCDFVAETTAVHVDGVALQHSAP